MIRAAYGDPDAVTVGDYHLPNMVAWALAGEPRGTDERMLELLAPFAGHRGRVCGLLGRRGLTAPRFGPGCRCAPSPASDSHAGFPHRRSPPGPP